MTYCLGIKLKSGLLAIADTRLTSGSETTSGKKLFSFQRPKHSMFIMTSGLRSVRDKAITYFNEVLEEKDKEFNKMYKLVNAFAEQLRRVAKEDREALEIAGYSFNLNAIVGGQLEDDKEPKLFLLYPQGNWVEVGEATPFVIIGNSGYGKPILNRVIKYDSPMEVALKAGFLSFDSTRKSANDVDYPIDVLMYKSNSYKTIEHRFHEEDLQEISKAWGDKLALAVDEISVDWMVPMTSKF